MFYTHLHTVLRLKAIDSIKKCIIFSPKFVIKSYYLKISN